MIVDLFAGPGGWEEGLATLGVTDVIGVELDHAACHTRAAAGHRTHRADVAALHPRTFHRFALGDVALVGLIASPPCQLYSAAGKGHGRDAVPLLAEAMHLLANGQDIRDDIRAEIADALEPIVAADTPDDGQCTLTLDGVPSLVRAEAERLAYQAALVLEPARWTEQLRPRWVALEQVPAVLPLWEALGHALGHLGYSSSAGILNAADYGVPQTRRRAVLVARLDGPARLPAPTHAKGGANGLTPWISMATALGWGQPARVGFPRRDDRGTSADGYRDRDWRGDAEPSFALTEKARSWVVRTGANSQITTAGDLAPYERSVDEPAPTLDGKVGGAWRLEERQPNGARTCQRIDDEQPAPALTAKSGEQWWLERPATTLSCDPRVFPPGGHLANDGRDNTRMVGRSQTDIHLIVDQALVLQSFDPGYPVQGTKSKQFQQIGNAMPPRLAAHVLADLVDAA